MHRFFQCQCWHSCISFKQFYDSRAFALKLLGQKRTQCHAQCLKYIPPFILHMSLTIQNMSVKILHFCAEDWGNRISRSLYAVVTNLCTNLQEDLLGYHWWFEGLVPEGGAVYGLTRAKGDAGVGSKPLCECALMSQAGALLLKISLVQMTEATALGVQKTASQY